MSGVLERVRAHGARGELQHVEVPEWGEAGKPLIVKFRRPSLSHSAEALAAHPQNPIRQNVDIFCQIALAEDGQTQLFKRIDGVELMESADPLVMKRLMQRMGIIGGPSDEETEKN